AAALARRSQPPLPGASPCAGRPFGGAADARRRAKRAGDRAEHGALEPRLVGPRVPRVLARPSGRRLADDAHGKVADLAADERGDQRGRGGTVQFIMQGRTYSHDGVARLLSRLQVVPDLTNVQLQSSTLSL